MAHEDPYRGQAARCPGCGELMTSQTAADAAIDLCARCGGIWLDWFDGSPPAIARKLEEAPAGRAPAEGPTRAECPRCRAPLDIEIFEAGPTVSRCSTCYGMFVPQEAIAELARLEEKDAPGEQGAFKALLGRLRALFSED